MTHMKKADKYHEIKLIIRVLTLALAVWALVKVYQIDSRVTWVERQNDTVIEHLMFKHEK